MSPDPIHAPQLDGASDWLNVAGPLRLRHDLRGKVVVLDFWTYGCINCIHIIPDLARLERKYRDEPVVIGVHSAKFTNERDSDHRRRAIVRHGIEHPVANDAETTIWQNYGVRAWPTRILSDPAGYIVATASGEGKADALDRAIAAVIAVFDERGAIRVVAVCVISPCRISGVKLRVLALLSVVLTACAANPAPNTRASNTAPISEASVRAHMEFLAGDALNGRGSGTRDEWIAASYIASQLRRWGVEPLGQDGGYVQQVDIERADAAAPPVLTFDGRRAVHGKDVIVQSLGGASVSGPLHRFREGAAIPAGAVVLMPEGAAVRLPTRPTGAAIVLMGETPQIRSRWDALGSRVPSVTPRMIGIPVSAERPAAVVLDAATYAAVAALGDGATIALNAELKPPQTSHTWNAMGKLTGTDARRRDDVILLTAHLDHVGNRPARDGSTSDTIYNGADDDASGSVAVLELAEALAKGPRLERTVMFTWFGSEESGGYGARYFIEKPPVPLDRIAANLEFEMIGRPDKAVPPHTLWLTGYERSNLGPELAKRGAKIVQDPHPDQNFFERSDNIQLARRGVIAQTVSSFGLHTDYHQPSDDVRAIDFAHMTDSIRSMLAPVRWLANSTFKPAWLPGKDPSVRVP